MIKYERILGAKMVFWCVYRTFWFRGQFGAKLKMPPQENLFQKGHVEYQNFISFYMK